MQLISAANTAAQNAWFLCKYCHLEIDKEHKIEKNRPCEHLMGRHTVNIMMKELPNTHHPVHKLKKMSHIHNLPCHSPPAPKPISYNIALTKSESMLNNTHTRQILMIHSSKVTRKMRIFVQLSFSVARRAQKVSTFDRRFFSQGTYYVYHLEK